MKDYSGLITEARGLATIVPASPSIVPDYLCSLADALEEAHQEIAHLWDAMRLHHMVMNTDGQCDDDCPVCALVNEAEEDMAVKPSKANIIDSRDLAEKAAAATDERIRQLRESRQSEKSS